MSDQPTVIIMAAGHGTRMRSQMAKVLHPLCGRPMITWAVEAARAAGAKRIVCVVRPREGVAEHLPADVTVCEQTEGEGTGAAVLAASDAVGSDETVVVMSGDHPLISHETIEGLAATHRQTGACATLLTSDRIDPAGFGRVVRAADGSVLRIVETKYPENVDPSELAIREANIGTYAFASDLLFATLDEVSATGGERYLTDVIALLRQREQAIAAHQTDDTLSALGINTRVDLMRAHAQAQRRIVAAHALAGVSFVCPETVRIDADVGIGPDTLIETGVSLRGATRIGSGCTIGPHTTITDTVVGDHVNCPHSYIVDAWIGSEVEVGPFAYVRPQTTAESGSKIGTFVEIKNSSLKAKAKVPHLSYVGDAEVGERTNIGAGNITANYDGRRKHRTLIGEDVHTGVNTSFIAPVSVGDRAYTGAGSVITDDVPDDALGIARPYQKNIEGYAQRVEEESRK